MDALDPTTWALARAIGIFATPVTPALFVLIAVVALGMTIESDNFRGHWVFYAPLQIAGCYLGQRLYMPWLSQRDAGPFLSEIQKSYFTSDGHLGPLVGAQINAYWLSAMAGFLTVALGWIAVSVTFSWLRDQRSYYAHYVAHPAPIPPQVATPPLRPKTEDDDLGEYHTLAEQYRRAGRAASTSQASAPHSIDPAPDNIPDDWTYRVPQQEE